MGFLITHAFTQVFSHRDAFAQFYIEQFQSRDQNKPIRFSKGTFTEEFLPTDIFTQAYTGIWRKRVQQAKAKSQFHSWYFRITWDISFKFIQHLQFGIE